MSNSFIHKVGKSISHCYKVTIERFSEFGSYASNPKYFPKVSIAVIVSSGFAGFCAMQIVDRKREVCFYRDKNFFLRFDFVLLPWT